MIEEERTTVNRKKEISITGYMLEKVSWFAFSLYSLV